jgi:O-antigen/teichoic acid export membrane protein
VEALRVLGVYLWLRGRGLLQFRWEGEAFREQWRLVTPLGTGSVLNKLNEHIGKVVVGNRMGAEPLAIYTTAAYQVPVVGIVQQTLADVVFPDMVRRARQDPMEGLKLWKRANVLTFSAILPAWALLTYFAEPLVRLLFTDAYAGATPFFQVFLLLMLRQCFQFSTPLRCVEDNASFARANALALGLNIALIVILMPRYGLWGPALGLVLGQLWIPFYLGWKVMKRFAVPLARLCEWPKLALAVLATALAFTAMYLSQQVWPGSFPGTIASVAVFGAVYALSARLFLREEYRYVLREFSRRGRRNACQSV